MRLNNKVAMVTGSSRGLGLAIAKAYAREGAAVVLNARHADALEQALAAVRRQTPDAPLLAVPADATTASGIAELVETTLRRFGRVDVLVNNAGTLGPTPRRSLLEHTEDDLAETLRINAVGPFLLTRALLPQMLERGGGSIINVISEAGLTGYAGWGAYGASKAALELLTQIWAAELQGSGVRINSVNPGELNTEMHFAAYPDEDRTQFADPDSVVETFVYLAADESATLNGRLLHAQAAEREV